MPNDDQQLEGTVETTPVEKRESEDTSEDLNLFDDSDDSSEDAPVSRKEYENLKKGAQKLATELGRLKKEGVKPTESEVKPEPSSVIKNLYFKANPEAVEIWDEVEKEAKNLGKDPFDLYEGSSYFKGEAKARAEVKAEEEENKAKIARPSSLTGKTGISFDKIDLNNSDHIKYLKENPKRKEEYNEWLKTNWKKL